MIPDESAVNANLRVRITDPDLLVYVDPGRPWWHHCLSFLTEPKCLQHGSKSLLLVRQPRWPIRHILLIARSEPSDLAALDWVVQIARPATTSVSILPVVPPWPGLHRISRHAQPPPKVLLAPNTVSGAMLAAIMGELRKRRIPSDLVLCTDEPDCRLRKAVASCDPDLVVVAAESHQRLLRWLFGELVRPLVRWIDRPVLVARPLESDVSQGSR